MLVHVSSFEPWNHPNFTPRHFTPRRRNRRRRREPQNAQLWDIRSPAEIIALQSVHMKVGQLPFLLHFNVVTAAPGAPGGCARCARVRGRFLPELVDSRGGVEQPLLSPRRPKHRFVSML